MTITKYGDIGTDLLRKKGLKIAVIEGQPRARVKKSPLHTMYEKQM
jgi:hypothetical protein